ncbi:MAG: sigma-70 family RNA polymerase sigma factor [Nannocystaceae bacterium]
MSAEDPLAPGATLGAIYSEHAGFVWRSLLRLGASQAEAEDLLHEVFLVVRRRLDDFEDGRSLRAWLYGIARGVAANHRRGRRREEARLDRLPSPSPPMTPEEGLQRRRAAALVAEFLATLDEPRRQVFELMDIEGLRGPEVAEALQIPLMKVHTLLRSARTLFHAHLNAPLAAAARKETA